MSVKKRFQKIDAHIGGQLSLARRARKLSQEGLAEKISITFQQLQKYEKGQNRVAASTLHKFSLLLEVPIDFFFEGLDKPNIRPLPKPKKEHAKLIKFYDRAPAKFQPTLISFLAAIAGCKEEDNG